MRSFKAGLIMLVMASTILGGCAGGRLAAVPASGAPAWPACGRADTFPGETWPAPRLSRGWNGARLEEARALFESLDSAAVMVVHRGRLIASWGDVDANFTAQSMRKALLSSLVGVAVDRGLLDPSATLEQLGIDDTRPALTPEERRATLQDVLRSRSSIFHSALYEHGSHRRGRAALAARKLADPERFRPGAYWTYNNWDFNVIGTIVQNAFRRPLGDLFTAHIATPLRMQDFRPANIGYTSKDDATERRFENWSEHRAYVFDISTRDLARYGLLYLNCGAWGARQIVSRNWVFESLRGISTRQGRGPDEQQTGFGDYGYLWQIERPGSRRLENLRTREPIYSATGARGHFMIIAPYLDLVIAHQPATVGGVGLEAQQRRATQGSPEVSEQDVERLFAAIITAHPDAATAWEPAAAGN